MLFQKASVGEEREDKQSSKSLSSLTVGGEGLWAMVMDIPHWGGVKKEKRETATM